MSLDAVRADVAVLDELLREIAQRPADPNRTAGLRWEPAEEAGVAAETTAALETLLDAYESGGSAVREEVRGIFRACPSFRWAARLPIVWESPAEFRRRLLHVSAEDQGADPRDSLMAIWSLCNRARERGINVEPVLREVAGLSSDTDHYGFGSMQTLIMRGTEHHALD